MCYQWIIKVLKIEKECEKAKLSASCKEFSLISAKKSELELHLQAMQCPLVGFAQGSLN